ncbi:MAG: nucleotide exchange factor GrpE [Clostridia bacterium]|nr:nucleotide exchange factor GrpE [Clostridia bacterium]
MAQDEKKVTSDEEIDAEAVAEEVTEAVAEEKETKSDKKKNKKLEEKIGNLEVALEQKSGEIAELNDKYLRMAAEYDNFRKRSAKEKEGIYADAYADALSQILPIIDNLERAVGITDADGVAKGLEMTLKGAADAMTRLGVEAFGAEGDVFDPNMHSAMMMVDDENHKEGEIVTVFQKGYKKGDKIIRYAMVTVAN